MPSRDPVDATGLRSGAAFAARLRTSLLAGAWFVIVAALAFAAINVLWDAEDEAAYAHPTAVAVGLALAATGSLLVARRWPTVVAAVSTLGVLGLTLGGFSRYVAVIGPCLALPWLARAMTPQRWGLWATGIFGAGLIALHDEPYVDGYVAALLLFFVPCLLAAVVVELVQTNQRLRSRLSSTGSDARISALMMISPTLS